MRAVRAALLRVQLLFSAPAEIEFAKIVVPLAQLGRAEGSAVAATGAVGGVFALAGLKGCKGAVRSVESSSFGIGRSAASSFESGLSTGMGSAEARLVQQAAGSEWQQAYGAAAARAEMAAMREAGTVGRPVVVPRPIALLAPNGERPLGDAATMRHMAGTVDDAVKAEPDLLDKARNRALFEQHPELRVIANDDVRLRAALAGDARLTEDMTFALYRHDPALFVAIADRGGAFSDHIHVAFGRYRDAQLREALDRAVAELAPAVARMTAEQVDQSVGEAVARALTEAAKAEGAAQPLKWAYKSGALSVSGEIGRFSVEQTITVKGLLIVSGGVVLAAKGHLHWADKRPFGPVEGCVGVLCVQVGKKGAQAVVGLNPDDGQDGEDAPM